MGSFDADEMKDPLSAIIFCQLLAMRLWLRSASKKVTTFRLTSAFKGEESLSANMASTCSEVTLVVKTCVSLSTLASPANISEETLLSNVKGLDA